MEQNKKMTALTEEDLENVTGGGAARNRLDYTSSNLTTSSQNLSASESPYRDADMAKEMATPTAGIKVLDTALQKCLDQDA